MELDNSLYIFLSIHEAITLIMAKVFFGQPCWSYDYKSLLYSGVGDPFSKHEDWVHYLSMFTSVCMC